MAMQVHSLKLVTIVGEAVLRDKLVAAFKTRGAKGFTITDVEGEGSRHLRAGEIPGQNVRIEMVVTPEVADKILEHVSKHYFPNYAVIAFMQEVSVVRGDKYI